MVDPLSVVSALAAASQLTELCLKMTLFLYEVPSRFCGSREFVNMTAQQVEQLTAISRQIISNPSLQTQTMSGILEACLHEAGSLYKFLQDVIILSRDSRRTRFKKTFTVFRNRELIEARAGALEKWKGLLALCISEINSANMHTTSRDIQTSMEKSCAVIDTTSSNVTTLADALPAIFSQLAVIEGELRDLTSKVDTSAKEAVSSARLTRNLECIMQHLMINQQGSIIYSHFGSKLLTHYLIPIPRNKTFTRFNDTIKIMKQRYSTGSRPAERILTLTGVACGGKTQAALEFCHMAQKDQQFGAIFWVKASSVTAIEKSFRAVANKLNVAPDGPIETRINTTMSILTAWPCPWLMVFDNYNGQDLAKDLGSYMPNSEQGAYLITRKLEDLTLVERDLAIHLPDLQLQDSLELLLNCSAMERNDENYEHGLKLVRSLEKIPRLIMQVGSYIKKHKISFAMYQTMLQEFDNRSVAAVFDEFKLRNTQQKLGQTGIDDDARDRSEPSRRA